jgi:RHS repeat-associated protein
MMPAAKHGDPQLGVDIHLCAVPPSPSPVPLPTPHMSIVFDPFDYVPIFGATVTVCGMKRATAGTNATVVHIPPGFPFTPKLPDKDDELFMGSATVVADGDPMSHISHPVLGCQVAGMISPPRLKKKNKGMMLLPTSFNLAIPTNVFVGGPPTISLLGMAFKAGFSALGRFVKSGLFRRIRQRLFRGLNPGFLKCVILRAEPVNILTGEVSVKQEDFTLPGRIPIEWTRSYFSGDRREGLAGHGWETPADTRLAIDPEDSTVVMHHPTVGPLFFARPPTTLGKEGAELELMDGAVLIDRGHEYQVRTKEDRIYCFAKRTGLTNKETVQEFPISRIEDLCGNYLEFKRSSGRLERINESAGRRIEIVNDNGRIREVVLLIPETGARHVFVRYEYDAEGDLVAVRDALNNPCTFAYNKHRMERHTDRNGLSFYYEYEKSAESEDWRVTHAWGDGGLYDYRFEYQDVLHERRITNSLGHTSTVKLNDSGLPINEIDPLGGMTVFDYDEAGRTTAVVDPGGHHTEYAYDQSGNLLKLTRPDGNAIVTAFNAANKATRITDPNGATWQHEWDERGLLTKQITPLGAESVYEYDAAGQLLSFINPLKTRTTLAFDGTGNLAQLADALGHTTRFTYDLLGNVTAKADPLSQITRYRYDAKGRLIQALLPSGASIACGYDAEDNLSRYVDENGAETRLEYFGIGEIARRLQPDGHTVEYHYDTEERLIAVTNQRGETYHLNRDALGRIIEEVDYWGQSRQYRYTASGYLQQSEDPLGRIIHYQTDPLGRILNKTLPDPAGGDEPFEETFKYDANGNLIACTNPHIRVVRKLDPEGRLLEECQGQECIVANTYDANGNRISRTTTRQINGQRYAHTVRYGYDPLDQAIRFEAEGHAPIELTRNAVGQITHEKLSHSVRRQLDCSADGYLTAQRVLTAERPVLDQVYHYDRAGNLTERRDSTLGVDQYTYDPLGRLVAHLDPQQQLKQYLNDPAGDRLLTRVREPQQGQEPSAWRRDGAYDGSYYSFDRAGNLTHRRGPAIDLQLTWDANQRLIESRANGEVTTYQYDPLGRRSLKQTGSTSTHFCWDGDALLGEANHVDLRDAGPSLQLQREWVYYPETFEPLALVQGYRTAPGGKAAAPELYLYNNDPNGCPTRLLDTAGKVVWAAYYSAWGGVEKMLTERVDNPIRLQGQYEDRETRLHYNRYRYYDANIGSFSSQDPLAQDVGPSLYHYAPSVVTWVDPLGLACQVIRETSRRRALQRAREFAQVRRPSKGGVQIPFEELNLESRGRNFSRLQADGATSLGRRDPISRASFMDHPDGHPNMVGAGHPEHHAHPHVHAINPAGEELIITY